MSQIPAYDDIQTLHKRQSPRGERLSSGHQRVSGTLLGSKVCSSGMLKKSPVTEWFAGKYKSPTPAQKEAWPKIEAGKNVLIVSPTGTGKTFAAFLAVLSELSRLNGERQLRNSIYAIYVSPLRALSYDLEKNLNEPLRQIYGDTAPIRVGLRTGDTPSSERQRQFIKPPHILLTTPESLMLLLTQKKWLDHLKNVRWLIVDEIHALAENKRGAH